MIPLDTTRIDARHEGIYPWVACLHPFVENSRGVLIHRPRSGATYNIHKAPHVSVGMWCGHHTSSDGRNLTFLPAPPEGKVLCARCEDAAVAAGLPTADELAGRHVHVGGVKAVVTCCKEDS